MFGVDTELIYTRVRNADFTNALKYLMPAKRGERLRCIKLPTEDGIENQYWNPGFGLSSNTHTRVARTNT